MRLLNLIVLALKQTWRHPARSLLTVLGVATGMFLYATVETMQQAMLSATRVQADDTVLVVYRENRFCPFTSRLPESYQRQIAAIDGVRSVLPMQVTVNNCSASLDVVTFRGVPPEGLVQLAAERFRFQSGSVQEWQRRSDAALVGEALARRRGLRAGDSFQAAGVQVQVVGVISSEEAQDQNVAYVHLPFLQQAARGEFGTVTQFNVTVSDPDRLDEVAAAIDATFADDQEPTNTRPEKAFVAQTAKDIVELIGFTRYVGLGAIVAIVALVANTILLAVRARVREFAILQTLGFGHAAIMVLVCCEALLLGLAGGLVGVVTTWLVLHGGGLSLSSEGMSIVFDPQLPVLAGGLGMAMLLGLLAGIYPAWQATRRPITSSLGAV